MIYIITGGPATGKGTRSEILADALNIPHISTGDMLREEAKKNEEIAQKLAKGELISDETVTQILSDRISQDDCANGFILDGYPRTLEQVKLLNQLLEAHHVCITKVIELLVEDELVFRRILERKKCDKCGRVYGIDFPPKQEDVCDDCGSELHVRSDDTRETLKKRIDTYKENSKEVLDYYRTKGILLSVDSSGHPENIIHEALNG